MQNLHININIYTQRVATQNTSSRPSLTAKLSEYDGSAWRNPTLTNTQSWRIDRVTKIVRLPPRLGADRRRFDSRSLTVSFFLSFFLSLLYLKTHRRSGAEFWTKRLQPGGCASRCGKGEVSRPQNRPTATAQATKRHGVIYCDKSPDAVTDATDTTELHTDSAKRTTAECSPRKPPSSVPPPK